MDRNIVDFIHVAKQLDTIHSLMDGLASLIEEMGYSCTFYSRAWPRKGGINHDFNMSEITAALCPADIEFRGPGAASATGHYESLGLRETDPFLRFRKLSDLPAIFGPDGDGGLFGQDAALAACLRTYYAAMAPCGIRHSFCIPTSIRYTHSLSCIGIHSDRDKAAFEETAIADFASLIAAVHVFEHLYFTVFQREVADYLQLDPKHQQVLRLLVRGYSNAEISTYLGVSIPRVSQLLKSLQQRLGIVTNRQLPEAAIQIGLVSLED